MERQFSLGIPYPVLVILGVVAAVKSKETLSFYSVDVSGLAIGFVFAHHQDIRFNFVGVKRGGLPHKTFYQGCVVLA